MARTAISLPSQTGNSGKYLTTNGSIASWTDIAGMGDVSGPASSTDGAIVLFDGVDGKTIKDSVKTIVTTLGSDDTTVPTSKATKDYTDGLVAGLLDYRGAYDASVNTFPASGGSGTAGAVLKGDMWIISVAGTLGGEAVQIGDSLIAGVDTPGQTASNWNILNSNISYVPEDVANKENTTIDTSTTKYPTVNLLKTVSDVANSALQDVVDDTTPTLGGNLNASDKNIIGAGSIGFTQELDNGSKTTDFSVDFSTDQKQKVTLTANTITLTLDTTDIKVGNYLLKIVNGGLATLTWAAESGAIYWSGGTAPTLTSSGTFEISGGVLDNAILFANNF